MKMSYGKCQARVLFRSAMVLILKLFYGCQTSEASNILMLFCFDFFVTLG